MMVLVTNTTCSDRPVITADLLVSIRIGKDMIDVRRVLTGQLLYSLIDLEFSVPFTIYALVSQPHLLVTCNIDGWVRLWDIRAGVHLKSTRLRHATAGKHARTLMRWAVGDEAWCVRATSTRLSFVYGRPNVISGYKVVIVNLKNV
jgi:hypothetical protein